MATKAQILADIEEMKKRFIELSSSILTMSIDTNCEFDRAIYGYMVVKPTKRLSQILTLDRELLVLVTNFDQQQVRTVSTIKKVIGQYKNRLDPNICIVIHKDKKNNYNLKNWGREGGLSLLPVYYDDLESMDSLERYLSVELYSNDPFDVTGPVSKDEHFFGRRTEASDLARKLSKGSIKSCLGIRKVGKTSIINRILDELRKKI